MGFSVDWAYEGYFAGISRDATRLFLRRRTEQEAAQRQSVTIWLNMTSPADVDELYAVWKTSGVTIEGSLPRDGGNVAALRGCGGLQTWPRASPSRCRSRVFRSFSSSRYSLAPFWRLSPRPRQWSAVVQSASADSLKVVLLGSGVGPLVNLQQFGASTLIEAGSERFLFDCGRGATIRLTQVGVPIGSISRLFLTHLHSDHVIQIPDLLLTGWVGGGRRVPFEVWGPEGTRDMMDHILQAFAFDIHMRRDVDEKAPGDGIKVVSHDITQGIVFDEQGVKVTAFLVDHGPVAPAFGYRVDYRGHSVALSGDTRVSENLIRFAQGVDVLVHEVVDADAVRARSGPIVTGGSDHCAPHHTRTGGRGIRPRQASVGRLLTCSQRRKRDDSDPEERMPVRFKGLKTC